MAKKAKADDGRMRLTVVCRFTQAEAENAFERFFGKRPTLPELHLFVKGLIGTSAIPNADVEITIDPSE